MRTLALKKAQERYYRKNANKIRKYNSNYYYANKYKWENINK